jgi:hypothetical protein
MATQSVDQVFKTSALITRALILGQLLFGAVAWFITDKGAGASDPDLVNKLTYVWFGLIVVGVLGAFVLQQRIGGIAGSPTSLQKIRDGQLTPAQVQSQIVVMWGLLEAPGLLGIVIFLLSGSLPVLLAALGYVVLCAVVFFPRRVWFDAFVA